MSTSGAGPGPARLATPPQVQALDLWVVASTAWGEARSERADGTAAVVHVIRNRQRYHPRWQGQSLHAICVAKAQFSCWNSNDPNYPKLLALTLATPSFAACFHLTLDVLSGELPSPVGRATHYLRIDVRPWPLWARGQTPVAVVGAHSFFANIPERCLRAGPRRC